MELSSSFDEWCCHSDNVVEGLPRTEKIVDDIRIWAPGVKTLESRLTAVLNRYPKINVTISKSKFEIGDKLNFAVSSLHTTAFFLTQNAQKHSLSFLC